MRGLVRSAAVVTGAAVVLLGLAAGVASASGAPIIAWSQGGTATTSYDYGTLNGGGGQTASQTFTLTNSGGRASGTVTVGLTGSSAFTITGNRCTGNSLGPGKSCTVTIKYAPAGSSSSDSGTLAATAEHGSANLGLAGKSGAPRLTLSPGLLACTPACSYNYEFDPVGAGGSVTQTFTVTNSGTVTSETLQLVPDDLAQFSTSNDACTGKALAPGGSCTFDEAFTSSAGCLAETFFNGPVEVRGELTSIDYLGVVAEGFCF